jgi:hypothetical protein
MRGLQPLPAWQAETQCARTATPARMAR